VWYYTTLHFVFYSLHPHGLFLNFSMCDIIQHFIFFIAYTNMVYILIFRCGIIFIYNLYLHELFFNFLMWDKYTNFTFFFYSLHSYSYELFFNFFIFHVSYFFIYIVYIDMYFFKSFSCEILNPSSNIIFIFLSWPG